MRIPHHYHILRLTNVTPDIDLYEIDIIDKFDFCSKFFSTKFYFRKVGWYIFEDYLEKITKNHPSEFQIKKKH